MMNGGLCSLKSLSKVQLNLVGLLSKRGGYIIREFRNGIPVYLDDAGEPVPTAAVTGLMARGLLIEGGDALIGAAGQTLRLKL